MIETTFKDTEVGRIPEDWTLIPIRELAKDMADGPFGSNLKTEHYTIDKQVRIIQLGNIGDCGWLDDNIKYTTYEHAKTLSRCIATPGSILVAKMMPAGRSVICPSEEKQYILGSDVVRIVPNEKLIAEYFVYQSKSDIYLSQIAANTQGSTRQRTSISKLKDIYIPFPSTKSEQTRIATALSNIDALISELGKLIKKKRAIKQGAMQQLLTGKKRLKGFSEPWVKSLIKDLYHVTRGYVLAMTKVDNHKSAKYPYPVFSSQTKDNGIAGYYSQYLYENAITWTTDGANAGDVKYRNGKFYCTNVCGVLLSDNGMANLCMAGILGLVSKSHVSYIGNPKLMNNTMAEIEIYHPSDIKEQIAISDILIKIDNEIISLEAKKAKFEQIKQGMMQQLLTGKIRLVETTVKTNATSANVHFRRSVLAAEIAERLYEEPTFGHVKMEKMLFLTERLCHIDIGSHYHRDAAGPYDNRALRSIDSQLKKQKWFDVKRTEIGNRYVPMQNCGKHKTYFDKYFSAVLPTFDKIIDTFKTQNTERCEIVATLYSAWEDLLHSNKPFTDADIVNEVLNNWHESKKRISKERWLSAIQWMRENGFAPDVRNNESRK